MYVVDGSDASLTWTYCKANKRVIAGFIIFLEFSSLNPRSKSYLISTSNTGNEVFKSKKRAVKKKFANRLVLLKKNESITFVIQNTVVQDSGYYRLEIRRDGFADLYSRTEIQVKNPGTFRNLLFLFSEILKLVTARMVRCFGVNNQYLLVDGLTFIVLETVNSMQFGKVIFKSTLSTVTTNSSVNPTKKYLNESAGKKMNKIRKYSSLYFMSLFM